MADQRLLWSAVSLLNNILSESSPELSRPVGRIVERLLALIFVALLFGATGGCQKSKEEQALERIAHRKAPGYLRVADLSPDAVSLALNRAPLPSLVQPWTVGPFNITPSGRRQVGIKAGAKVLYDNDLVIPPANSGTLVVTGKGVKVYWQKARIGVAPNAAAHVIVMADAGPVTVRSDGEPLFDQVGAETNTDLKTMSSGPHQLMIETTDGRRVKVPADFAAGNAYTIFVLVVHKIVIVRIVCDSPRNQPMAVGGSAVG